MSDDWGEVSEASRIRVLCVDDHALMLEGLAMIINAEPDMCVVGTAKNAKEAIAEFQAQRPDVTLMDLELPLVRGVDVITAIKSTDPAAKVVVLTMYSGEEDMYRALQAGAATYLLKDTLSRDLVRVIRDVYAGRFQIPEEIAARLKARASLPVLTDREVEVLELVQAGLRNREISSRLGVSVETVHKHIGNIFVKLDVRDRTEAVAVGIRRGILHVR